MFGASKPLASLSSGLLARKGQARPAMRPQAVGGFVSAAPIEDLGWNDMGQGDTPEPAPAPVVAAVPDAAAPVEPVPVPPVLAQREALKDEIESRAGVEPAGEPGIERAIEPAPAPEVVKSVSVATATRLARESAQQTKKAGKAAFTLRLDAERHLRLRLASALTNQSAQMLVTNAVDTLLTSLPDVELLVSQLPPARKSNR